MLRIQSKELKMPFKLINYSNPTRKAAFSLRKSILIHDTYIGTNRYVFQ